MVLIAKQAPPRDINSLLRTNRAFSALLRTTLLDSAVDRDHPEIAQRALQAFAYRGDDESVLRLFRRGALTVIGEDRVLHEAIEKGPENVVCNLWRNGAKILSRGDQERTPIMIAAKQGYTEAVRMMMEFDGFDINEQDQWLRTALYTAVCEGNESTVEMLMSHPGIDPNTTDQFGDAPLHVAAECGWSNITRLLLSNRRTLINAKDARGMAPLHIAVSLDHLEVVELLLRDPRLKINEREQRNYTPLHMAAIQGQRQMVHALLQHPDIRTNLSNDPPPQTQSVLEPSISHDWVHTPPHVTAVVQSYDEIILNAANDERSDTGGTNFLSNTPVHMAACHYSSIILFLVPQIIKAEANSDSSAIALAKRWAYDAEISQAIIDHANERSGASVKRELDVYMQVRPNKRARKGASE